MNFPISTSVRLVCELLSGREVKAEKDQDQE